MTRIPRRILVSAFGSAGDILPLVPVMRRLLRDGHDVRCAVPRALSLVTRAEGIPTYTLGSGAELRALGDPALYSTRFDGWASWRDLVAGYVGRSLGRDVVTLERVMGDWSPHIVVTATFAAAARLAAHRRRVPRLAVSIYPQHLGRLPSARSFAAGFRRSVSEEIDAAAAGVDPDLVCDLAWGVSQETVLLHDQALLYDHRLDVAARAVGFPYYDSRPVHLEDLRRAQAWMASAGGPVVAVTAGSFLGMRQAHAWSGAIRSILALERRALVVGPHRSAAAPPEAADGNVLVVGFLPLSRILPQVEAVVHHGGIGTTFGTVRAGKPAAVVAQAFDQPHNARLVDRAGVGVDASRCPLVEALAHVVHNSPFTRRANEVAATLTPPEVAVDRLAARILAGATNGRRNG